MPKPTRSRGKPPANYETRGWLRALGCVAVILLILAVCGYIAYQVLIGVQKHGLQELQKKGERPQSSLPAPTILSGLVFLKNYPPSQSVTALQ